MFASDAARLFEAMGSPAVTGEAVDTFRHWVNCKVLPAIFATGGYILNPDCISSAMVSDMDRMPLPAEAGVMLSAIAQNPVAIRVEPKAEDAAFERLWRSAPLLGDEGAEQAPRFDASFFRLARSFGRHPVAEAINTYVDLILLPAIFENPEYRNDLLLAVAAANDTAAAEG